MTVFHPRKNDMGQSVEIRFASQPIAIANWVEVAQRAIAIPGGDLPAMVNGSRSSGWRHRSMPQGGKSRSSTERRCGNPS